MLIYLIDLTFEKSHVTRFSNKDNFLVFGYLKVRVLIKNAFKVKNILILKHA